MKSTFNGKPPITLNSKKKTSDILAEETKQLEDKLDAVKKMMELEKEKRSTQRKNKDGTLWRSATTQQQIKGYSEMVLTQHRINQPNLPPTSLILGKENQQNQTQTMEKIVVKLNSTGNINEQQKKNIINMQQQIQQQIQIQNQPSQPKQQPSTTSQAASNLSKALRQQSEDFQEVDDFLGGMGLEKYKETFLDNGVEELDVILELDEKHLEQMSIPLGHKLKIMKKIKDIRKDKGISVPESRQGNREKAAAVESIKQPAAKVQEPNESSGGVGTDNQEKSQSKSGGIGTSNSLLDGVYDENEAHNQFLQALNAWRTGGKTDGDDQSQTEKTEKKAAEKTEKKVRFNDEPINHHYEEENEQEKQYAPVKKTNFLLNVGDDCNWNVIDLPQMPQFEEKEIKPDYKQNQDTKYAKKDSCWHCFRMFPSHEAKLDNLSNKRFCSDSCCDLYSAANKVSCQLEGCKTSFMKMTQGLLMHGKWFCSESCSNKDPETQKLRELHEKGIEFKNEKEEDLDNDYDDDFEL